MFAAPHRMGTVKLLWLKDFAPVRFNSNLFVAFASDWYHIFISFCPVSVELFRLNDPISCSLRLTCFKVSFVFQIVATRTNDRYSTYTKTLQQFLAAIIAKSSLKISGLNITNYFQAWIEGNDSRVVKMHSQYFNMIRVYVSSRRLAKHLQFESRECKYIPHRGNKLIFLRTM